MHGPFSLEELFEHMGDPTTRVMRCAECRRIQCLGDGDDTCGPDFESAKFCSGTLVLIEDPPQDALLAALRLGGEEAVLMLIFDGCKRCVVSYLYGGKQAKSVAQRVGPCTQHLR